jgi:3-oxoacyl-[acyl-carrier-protein] synthase II
MELGEFSNALVGGSDELTANSFAIMSRLGYWKRKPVNTRYLLDDHQRGTIAGEGASFLFLENQKRANTYAMVSGVATFLKPASYFEVSNRLHHFLGTLGLKANDIDLVILGLNGDPRTDQVYNHLAGKDFPDTPLAYFKHLCGEYHTASVFATWLAALAVKTQSVPEVVLVNQKLRPSVIKQVLIYNHFRENNHAFILLTST